MGSVAKHVFLVTDPAKLEATMRTAFEIARTGRPGPVVIDMPKDVQNWSGEFQGERPAADARLPRSAWSALRATRVSTTTSCDAVLRDARRGRSGR